MGGTTIKTAERRLSALQVQKSSYGLPVPTVYGTQRIAGNLVWYGGFKAIPHVARQSQGGKGGGGVTQESTTYTYEASLILSLCEGPIGGIGKVWRENSELAGTAQAATTLAAIGLDVALGELGQPVWGYLQTMFPTRAIPYSGIAYIKGASYQLGGDASVPNHSFEVRGFFAGGEQQPDANPADVLADYLTNERYGLKFPAAQLGDLTALRDYCNAAGLLFSPTFEEQSRGVDDIKRLCKLANCEPVWSEGKLKFVPYGDTPVSRTVGGTTYTFTPDVTPLYDLTDDDFLGYGEAPINLRRKSSADAKNHVTVEFKNRANGYAVEVAEAKDQASIERDGLRSADVVSAPWICTPEVAQNVAQLLLQRELYTRNDYEFPARWKFAALEAMDIVTLTDPGLGLFRTPVRITKVDEDEQGRLMAYAEDFPQGIGHAPRYATPTNLTSDPDADSGDVAQPVVFEVPPEETSTGLGLYVAVTGVSPFWAGADVWLSLDEATYTRLGRVSGGARYGSLVNAIGAGDGALRVQLAGLGGEIGNATAQDATLLKSLLWVDGEYAAHGNAQLVGANAYDLFGLVRGAKGTPAAPHAAGAPVVRVDDAVLRSADLSREHLGRTVNFKFVSYDTLSGTPQRIEDVVPYGYTIRGTLLGAKPPVPTLLMATPQADGINLTWARPTWRRTTRTIVERSSAADGSTGWLALATVDGDGFVDPERNGATWFYRVRAIDSFDVISDPGPVVTAKAKTVADGADVTGNITSIFTRNPSFEAGDTGYTRGTGWTIAQEQPNARTGSWRAAFAGSTAAIASLSRTPAAAGDVVVGTCWFKAAVGTDGTAAVRLVARDAAGTSLGNFSAAGITAAAAATYVQSRVVATMPANTASVEVAPQVSTRTTGTWYLDDLGGAISIRSLDETPDGATFARPRATQLQQGLITGLSQGNNLLPNPGFERNAGNYVYGTTLSLTTSFDGWVVPSVDVRWVARVIASATSAHSGNNYLLVRLQGNPTIGSGETTGQLVYGDPVYVRGGDQLVYGGYIGLAIGSGATLPAGASRIARIGIIFFDTNNAFLTEATIDVTAPQSYSVTPATQLTTVPAGASYARVYAAGFIVNNSGAVFAPADGRLYADCRFDDLFLIRRSDLDSEVVDGLVYGRVVQTALTGGQPDMARPGVINRLADFIGETAGRRWAGETGATVGGVIGAGGNVRNGNRGNIVVQGLDEIDDGNFFGRPLRTGLQLGRVRTTGASGNAVANPGFELNQIGAADAASVNRAGAVCDGWDVVDGGSGLWGIGRDSGVPQVGTRCLYLSAQPNFPIGGGGGTLYGRIWSDPIPVTPGELWKVAGACRIDANAALPSGFVRAAFLSVLVANAAGGLIAELGVATTSAATGTYVNLLSTLTVPAGAATMRVTCSALLQNNNAGTVSTPNGLCADVRFDSVGAVRLSQMDTEIQDGNDFARVATTALTGNQPDMARPGLLNRTLDFVANTASWVRTRGRRVDANGDPYADLSEPITLNRSADFIAESAGRRFAAESGATVGARWGQNVVNQPRSSANLVNKGTFADLGLGLWSGAGIGTQAQSESWGGSLIVQVRDNTEVNKFDVVPGETLYVNGRMFTVGNAYTLLFGVVVFDKTGASFSFPMGIGQPPGVGWTQRSGAFVVPAAAVTAQPYIILDGPGGNQNLGPAYLADLAITRHELGANITETRVSRDTAMVDGEPAATTRGRATTGFGLTQPNSGVRVGNQRNQLAITVANLQSKLVGATPSASYDAGSPALVTISVPACQLVAGSITNSYTASSGGVSQPRNTSRTYYLFYDDGPLMGGTFALGITTDANAVYASDSRVFIGTITVTVPASGGGTAPPGTPGKGGGQTP